MPQPEELVPVEDDENGRFDGLRETGKFPLHAYRNIKDKQKALGCLLWFDVTHNRDSLRKPPDNLTDAEIDGLWRDLLESCVRLEIPMSRNQRSRAERLGVLK